MEELSLLKKLGRVEAPPGFEQRVMAQLSLRRKKQIKARYLRLSMAGAFSTLIVLFIVLNVFILPQKGVQHLSESEQAMPAGFRRGPQIERNVIPIIESVDYTGEIRSIRHEPRTVYILEQISDTTDSKFKY